MDSLLLGAVLDDSFSILNEKLRASTIEIARRRFNRVITEYSPWLCCAPLIAELPADLAYLKTATRGDLLQDDRTLATMAAFMDQEGRASIANLPGESAQWLPGAAGDPLLYSRAIDIIRDASPVLSYLLDQVVDFVVPLGGGRNRGFSTHLARGAIFRALPAGNDAYDVAIDIVHEIGHQVLFVWQSVDPILASDHTAPVFSQIRRIDRPAIQTYHATVALAFMRFLELRLATNEGMRAAAARRGASYSESLVHSLRLSIESIRQNCEPTDLGTALLNEMEELA